MKGAVVSRPGTPAMAAHATPLKTIVVPLDSSPFSERALPYALDLAHTSAARLIVLQAAKRPPALQSIVDPIDAKFDVLDSASAELWIAVARHRNQGVRIEPHVYSGETAQAIVHAAQLNNASLIAMATHGRSGLARWMYGNVAERVIRMSHTPVLLVPITCETNWAPDQTKRILVGLDGSNLAEEILGPVSSLARELDSELMLIRVVAAEQATTELTAADVYLGGVAKRLQDQGLRVQVRALQGHAPERLAALAREMDARMIAMATHGRSGIARQLLGSVAAEVLDQTTIPLLVFRPAKLSWQALKPEEAQPETEGTPVSVSITGREAQLLTEAVALLLSTTEKEEHLAQPLLELMTKLAKAQGESLEAVESG